MYRLSSPYGLGQLPRDLFCTTLETLADKANSSFPHAPTFPPRYTKLYHTVAQPVVSKPWLQYTNVYVDGLYCLTQGSPPQQWATTEIVLKYLNEIYPSLAGKLKDSISLKKAVYGDVDWAQIKEIMGWITTTRDSKLRLSSKRLRDLVTILAIPPTQRQMSQKRLEKLIGKLCSMYLAILGAIGHFYHIQMVLTKSNRQTVYISNRF